MNYGRVGEWAGKTRRHVDNTRLGTAWAIHKKSPLDAYVFLLGPQGAHRLFNSPIGNALLRIDESRLIFEPNRYFPGVNRYLEKDSPLDPDDPATYGLHGYQKIMLEGPPKHPNERYLAWYKPPADDTKPIIAYFHGSSGTLDVRAPVLAELAKSKRGCGVMIVAYPGFKGSETDSTGRKQPLSMEGCYRAGQAMVDWVRQQHPQSDVAYVGESMGGAVALHTAHAMKDHPPKAIICLNTFYSIPAWIKDHFDRLNTKHIKNHFNSGALIGDIDTRILVMHATHDEITKPHQSLMLKDQSDAVREQNGRPKNVSLTWLEDMNHRLSYPSVPQNPDDPIPKHAILGPLRGEEIIDPRKVANIINRVQDFLAADALGKDNPAHKAIARRKRRRGESHIENGHSL